MFTYVNIGVKLLSIILQTDSFILYTYFVMAKVTELPVTQMSPCEDKIRPVQVDYQQIFFTNIVRKRHWQNL